MKRTLLIILLFILFVPFSEAQLWRLKRIELSAGFGTATFFGDVGGFSHGANVAGLKDITLKQTRFNMSFSGKYRITQFINARVSLAYGVLHATDERGSNQKRGFDAYTTIFEPALIGEYYFVKNSAENSYLFNKGRGKGIIGFLKSLDFYAFTGIGGLSYSIEPNGKLVSNVHYHEGNFTAVLPLGVGSTMSAYPNINIGLELGFRYALTDYLDGYHTQYSSANDVYYFLNLTVTYRLKLNKNVLSSFRR